MQAPDDLVNKGFILSHDRAENGRTFIVTGLHRSGTSLVASILQHAGLFIGDEINDIVFEDEAIARALDSGNMGAMRRIIEARNAGHSRWGFKFPMLSRALEVGQVCTLFDRPRLIVTFRDPVAMAVRTSLSEYQEPMRSLREIAADQAAMMAFVQAVSCPTLLLSYEKALAFPHEFVAILLGFCGIEADAGLFTRLLGLIEPSRSRYIAGARRRYEGSLEGIRGEQLYGWCRLSQSSEPVAVEILVDDRVVTSLTADIFRQDLLDAGIGNGCHGFFVPLRGLDADHDSIIRVRVPPHGIELENSGKRLRDYLAT